MFQSQRLPAVFCLECKPSQGFFDVVLRMAEEELLHPACSGPHMLWIMARKAAALEATAELSALVSRLVSDLCAGGWVRQRARSCV